MLDEPLYISEPNTIYCEINDANDAPVTGATVTFSVTEIDGDVIGTGNVSMSYVAGRTRYEGTYPAADAALLNNNTEYEVRITATGYTHRRLVRKAQYRGRT